MGDPHPSLAVFPVLSGQPLGAAYTTCSPRKPESLPLYSLCGSMGEFPHPHPVPSPCWFSNSMCVARPASVHFLVPRKAYLCTTSVGEWVILSTPTPPPNHTHTHTLHPSNLLLVFPLCGQACLYAPPGLQESLSLCHLCRIVGEHPRQVYTDKYKEVGQDLEQTHTHRVTYTQTHTHTDTHARTHARVRTHTQKHTQQHAHTATHTHTATCTHSHAHAHTATHTRTSQCTLFRE